VGFLPDSEVIWNLCQKRSSGKRVRLVLNPPASMTRSTADLDLVGARQATKPHTCEKR